jgi:hypothetical protein
MNRLILSFILLCNIGFIRAQNIQPANWWPQAGQAAASGTTNGWYYHSDPGNEYLAFDGTIISGTRIVTKFGPLIWQPYKNISIKFDATMPARSTGTITMVNIGSNNVWGGAGILVEFTGYGLRVVKNFDYVNNLIWIDTSESYKSSIGSGGVVVGNEINISATGLMTFKVGNYVCPTTYQADVTLLDATANEFVLFCPGATGFRLKNVIAKKGAIANSFFPEYKYTINCSSNNGVMGSVTGNGEFHKTADVTLSATASSGYHFVNWTESGTLVSTNANYTFQATASRTLVANFEPNTVAISSGTTNASSIAYTTSDITVANGAELNIDATKTLKSVTLAPGAKLTLSTGTLTTTNGITLESNATGTATMLGSGILSGIVTAKQYLGSARNWYVSSPVSNTSAPATNMDYYYEYVEAGNNTNFASQPGSSTLYWKGLANGTTMEVGKGYIGKTNAGTTVQFSGTPNNGDITTTFDLTRNDSKGRGFNLVGNPYPSYIDWADVATANPNLENTYYYRTKNTNTTDTYTFVTWNGAGSNYVVSNGSLPANTSITRFIPPTQAFWVRVKLGNNATKMYFNNGMREHRDVNNNLMKAPSHETRTSLRLQLQNGTESDEMLIYQDTEASNGYDNYDSPKMLNNSSIVPDLYTVIGSERLVINGLKTITDYMEIPLGFSLNSAANLKFKVSEQRNLPQNFKVFLRDKQENNETELTPETEYAFSTNTAITNNESRFSLLFKTPGATTGAINANNECVSVFVNSQNQITIIVPEKSIYSIYNALGQLIENGVINSKLRTQNSKIASGVYVVKVNNLTERVILK